MTKHHIPETGICSDFTSKKFQNGGGQHSEIALNGYNSGTIACQT